MGIFIRTPSINFATLIAPIVNQSFILSIINFRTNAPTAIAAAQPTINVADIPDKEPANLPAIPLRKLEPGILLNKPFAADFAFVLIRFNIFPRRLVIGPLPESGSSSPSFPSRTSSNFSETCLLRSTLCWQQILLLFLFVLLILLT